MREEESPERGKREGTHGNCSVTANSFSPQSRPGRKGGKETGEGELDRGGVERPCGAFLEKKEKAREKSGRGGKDSLGKLPSERRHKEGKKLRRLPIKKKPDDEGKMVSTVALVNLYTL